jgi:hypothetical protein
MNKTETAYAQRLDLLAKADNIGFWGFEAIKLKLADGAWYTPDFLVQTLDTLEIHEVKGFFREAAKVRWKVAKSIYGGMFKFVLVRKGVGGWTFHE